MTGHLDLPVTPLIFFHSHDGQGHHSEGDQATWRANIMCSISSCPFCKLFILGGLFAPFPVKGLMGGWGWVNSVARPWVSISPHWHLWRILPFLSYLAHSKRVSACPFDPDTIPNAALETKASSSGKKSHSLSHSRSLNNQYDFSKSVKNSARKVHKLWN